VLPYNRLLQRRLVATGHVPCYLAWGDQVIAAGCALVWPELFAPAMVAAMLDVALAAVMVGRVPPCTGSVVGAVLFAAGAVAVQLSGGPAPEGHLLAVACFAVSAVATAYAVGTVAGLHRAGQEQLGALLDSLEVVIYEMDAETLEVRYLSPYLSTITGRPVEEYLGDPAKWLGLVHRRDSVRLLEMVGAAAEQRRSYDLEYRIFDGNGQLRWMRNIAAVESGPPAGP
jgi:PAS domain-containing protein